MVVFTCNHCGDSLQKPRVEKHYNLVCKTVKNLTCVDCLKDFKGEEYVAHTKCFTEDERYAAKGSLPNGIVKKGELKQESWTEMIRSIINEETNISLPHRNLLNIISSYNNVPRKKPKFINFIKNVTGGRALIKDIEAVWDSIEKYKVNNLNKQAANGNSNNDQKTNEVKSEQNKDLKEMNGKNETKTKKKKSKHQSPIVEEENNEILLEQQQKVVDDKKDVTEINGKNETKTKKKSKHPAPITEEENSEILPAKKKKVADVENGSENVEGCLENGNNGSPDKKFDFQNKILEIVQSKGSISLKKLEKKVIKAYLKHFSVEECPDKVLKKYNKKLKKINELQVEGDIIKLIE